MALLFSLFFLWSTPPLTADILLTSPLPFTPESKPAQTPLTL
jgi:hypothetical protein